MPLRLGRDACAWDTIDAVLVQPRSSVPFWKCLPLGCLAIGEYLSSKGLRVALWDAQHDPSADEPSFRDLLARSRVRCIGFSVLSTGLAYARSLARVAREVSPGTRLIVGGQHVSSSTLDTFPEADILVSGEGELFMERFLRDEVGVPEPGAGPCLMAGDALTDLQVVPPISTEVLRVYRSFGELPRLGIMVSRGCPYECTFCHFDGRSRRVRRYAPAVVGEFVERAHRETGAQEIFFLDDVFTLSRDWVMDVVAELHRRGLGHLRYICFSHVGLGNRELFRALAQVGFVQVQLGVESGDPAIRARMRKRFSNDDVLETVDTIVSCGIEANCLFILGYAGETAASMRRTLELAGNLPATLWFSMAQPLPGTVFLEEARTEGTLLETDYAEYQNSRIVYLPAGVTLDEMRQIQGEAEALRVRHQRFAWTHHRED